MPPHHINLSELYNLKQKRENIKKKSYDRIIELCHRRIRNIAQHGGQNTFYQIQGMLIGYPLYNITDCMNYVVDALRKNGFLVQIVPSNEAHIIYISWDPNELKNNPLQKTIEPPTAQPMKNRKKDFPF